MRSNILNYGMTALLLTIGLAAQLQGLHHGNRAKGGTDCTGTTSNGLF